MFSGFESHCRFRKDLCGMSSLQLAMRLPKRNAAEEPTSKFDIDTDTRYLFKR